MRGGSNPPPPATSSKVIELLHLLIVPPTHNNLVFIADGTVVSPQNGTPYTLKCLQEDNVLI